MVRSELEKMHFAGPVPDDGDCPTELEGKWRVHGIWIDPKLWIAGRKEEMEHMRKMGVFEVVDEKECYDKRLQTSHVEMGGQDEGREMPFEIGLSRKSRRLETETNSLDQKTYFHSCRRRKG